MLTFASAEAKVESRHSRQVLEVACGNLMHIDDIQEADIVMLETEGERAPSFVEVSRMCELALRCLSASVSGGFRTVFGNAQPSEGGLAPADVPRSAQGAGASRRTSDIDLMTYRPAFTGLAAERIIPFQTARGMAAL